MKRKIVDKRTGRVVREWEQRDPSILQGQLRNPPTVYRNKKKYTRKQKHKQEYNNND